MAGGERRAEIEAVARALAYNELGRESGWSAYRPQAATVLRYLNRVRDARGDDEGARLFAMRTSTDPAAQAEAHFRSPQDEDHEAAVQALRDSLWSTWGAGRQTTDWPSDAQLREAFDAALSRVSRVSPSRDGSVAVERIVRWALEDLLVGDVKSASLRLTGLVGGIPPSPIAPHDSTVAVEDVAAWLRTKAKLASPHIVSSPRFALLELAGAFEREFASPASTGDRAPDEDPPA